jgi:hypothetical protein
LEENKEINEEDRVVKMMILDEKQQVMREREMEFRSVEIDSKDYHSEYLDGKMEPK